MTEDTLPPTKRIRPLDNTSKALPTETLYLNNLNDKIKKPGKFSGLLNYFSLFFSIISPVFLFFFFLCVLTNSIKDLKTALYMLFSTYGQVISIIALKTPKMRGQAHVVFNSTTEAGAALKALQGFELFDKPVRIAYAKSKSDVIAKRDGTFKLRPPPPLSASSLPPVTVKTTIAAFDSSDDDETPTAKRKRDDEGEVAYAHDSSSNDEDDDNDKEEDK